MEEYYKFLQYQVGESQTCFERCLLVTVRICLFCNASHIMHKKYNIIPGFYLSILVLKDTYNSRVMNSKTLIIRLIILSNINLSYFLKT